MPNIQKKGADWKDESGIAIPYNRTSIVERTKELKAGEIHKEAKKVSESLKKLFQSINDANKAVSSAIDKENKQNDKKAKETKGNFTWYNFDRSIKIEVSVNETIRFDEAMIAAARKDLDAFIEKNVQGTDDIIRQLINSAFSNTKGGLDSKKVMSLLKYRTKIKDKLFQAALDKIENSISRPSSKRYYRIWERDDNGEYQNIELNFSSL